MFNNFQIDSSIDHGMSMSNNSHYEHHQLHAQQHQYAQQPDPQPPMSSMNGPTPSTSTTPVSSSATPNGQDVNGTPGPSNATSIAPPKPAYGSGEPDDGYTLVFANIEEFQAWRAREEEGKVVEFVKGDTHGSKAVPPRFKDHTKLVCARHTRSGRKKYVKKFPERQRKLPSRKLDGEGCPASISYKTFFHTDEVRACYNDKHSHEIGEANLLYTRRGRKAAQEKGGKLNTLRATLNGSSSSTSPPMNGGSPPLHTNNGLVQSTLHVQNGTAPHHQQQQQQNTITGPSTVSHDPSLSPTLQSPHHHLSHHAQHTTHPSHPHPIQHTHQHPVPHPHQHTHNHNSMPAAISLIAPLPPAPPPAVPHPSDVSQERWDRMQVLFASIRQHARGFEYPGSSVAALESVLIRLYLESPLTGGLGPGGLPGTGMNGMGEGGHGT